MVMDSWIAAAIELSPFYFLMGYKYYLLGAMGTGPKE